MSALFGPFKKGDSVVPRSQASGPIPIDNEDWDIGEVVGSSRAGQTLVHWRIGGAVFDEYTEHLRLATDEESDSADCAGYPRQVMP